MKVAVTGVGVLTALGDEVGAVRARLAAGDVGSAPITQLPLDPPPEVARVHGPRLRDFVRRRKDVRLFARPSALLLPPAIAALGAWAGDREQLGLFVGVGREPADEGESAPALAAMARGGRLDMARVAGRGRDLYPPLLPLKSLPNMALAHVAIQLGIRGESGTCTGGPMAGVHALREAAAAVYEGRAPAALVGATDSWLDGPSLRDWARLDRPDAPGEAAVALLLEPAGAPGAIACIERLPAGAPRASAPSWGGLRRQLGSGGAADALLELVFGGGRAGGVEGCEVVWRMC